MTTKKEEYKEFYDKKGYDSGWSFKEATHTEEGVEFELYNEVLKLSKPTDKILDIGTGGAEKILQIADKFESVVAIDNSDGMVATALKNLEKSGLKNTEILKMDAESIDLNDESFDIVSCRHSAYNASEVYRLLKNGGYFLTQQVGELDKENLARYFERSQHKGLEKGYSMKEDSEMIAGAGLEIIIAREYSSTEYYKDRESLVYLLENAPIIMNFGREEDDMERLDRFIKDNTHEKGIKTNAHRVLIIAKKQ